MSKAQPDPAAYRHAAMQLAWEQFEPNISTAWVTHVGSVVAALRTWELTGGPDGAVTYLDLLYDRLADDPFARAAANELEALTVCVQKAGPLLPLPTGSPLPNAQPP